MCTFDASAVCVASDTKGTKENLYFLYKIWLGSL